MARISEDDLKRAREENFDIKVLQIPGRGLAFVGPWVKDGFETYTECLFANQDYKRINELREMGLNEHGQTKEQEKAFNERKKVAIRRKEQAEVAKQMVEQTK